MGMELPNRPKPHRLLLRELGILEGYSLISGSELSTLKGMIYGSSADHALAKEIINNKRSERLLRAQNLMVNDKRWNSLMNK